MPSVQRYLSGRDNLARTATLAASSVRASTAIERVSARRTGGGRVRMGGSYTGHEAASVEVEIVSAGGVPRASVPQFIGVGNGRLTVQSVDAAAALQEFTITLADLGIETATAGLDVREVRIRARAPGSGGNALHITVQPALTRTATAWALLAPWSTSTATQTGPQWDFGGLPLSPKDELDAASPRIAFGFDPQVYRPWRKFKDGAWQFGLSPALQRDVPASTAVYSVTGGYVVTVSDGMATETFGDTQATPAQAAIVTFHDLLTALAGSALVEVAGVVAADRTSGGQAAIDVPLRTSAWLLSLGGKVQLRDVAVPSQAPTQSLTVRCINADAAGQERWSVLGDISGALPDAITGEPYTSPAAAFTVPRMAPVAVATGRWSFKFNPAARDESKGLPSVCVRPFRFGVNAQARTVTFRYAKRPPADCRCSDMPTPHIPLAELGLEEDMDQDNEDFMGRLRSVYAWREAFVRDNTRVRAAQYVPGTPPNLGEPERSFWTFTATFSAYIDGRERSCRAEPVGNWDTSDAAEESRDAFLNGGDAPVVPAGTVDGGVVTINGVQMRVYGMSLAGNYTALPWALPLSMAWPVTEGTTPGIPASPGTPGVMQAAGYLAQARDLDWLRACLDVLMPCLRMVYAHDAARAQWDALFAEVQNDLQALRAQDVALGVSDAQDRFLDRYRAASDNILLAADLLPKSESSSADAGGCWVDRGDTHWWVDVDGYFLPAFTNESYISARRDTDTGRPYSTREFGFGLVVACPDRLVVGDEVTVRIEQVDTQRLYQVGDEATLQTVAGDAAWLTGGVDGTDVQTWRVLGSGTGPLPDYIVPTDGTPAPVYDQAGVALRLALGGIPFQLGDAFTFAVEAGQFRWRQGGGAWSALADIPPGGQAALADGLQVVFDAGAAPSFVPGDAYAFAVHQPWAASHVQDAQATAWGWEGSSASMEIDLGAVQQIGAIALARYQLPGGAAVAAEVSQDGAAWSAPLALDVTRPVSVAVFHLFMAARFVRLLVTNAPGGSIGWIWCGQPLATEHHASSCDPLRRWASTRGAGVNAAALYAGAGTGWKLAWEDALLEPDVAALLGLGDWAQAHDEPLVFVPHHLHPGDSSLVRWSADALQISDIHAYQPDNEAWRLMSGALDLEPVFA